MSPPDFDVNGFFGELATMAAEQRQAFKRPWSIAFRLAEGPCFLLDLSRPKVLSHEWRADADAVVLCNVASVAAMARGELDVTAPAPGQVCVCTGNVAALADLGRVLAPQPFAGRG